MSGRHRGRDTGLVVKAREVDGERSPVVIPLDAFVSYSRVDSEHAEWLVEGTKARGRMLWIDSDGIPPGAPWRRELGSAIEAALSFVCILSPHWLRSHECRLEYDRAFALGKRIIPVLVTETESIPPAIASLNWIDAREASKDEVVDSLLQAIDTDYERVKEHTNYLARALRWSESGEDRSLLLRGTELVSAENWIGRAGAQPEATPLQRRYVATGREDEHRRKRRRNVSVAVAAVVSVVLAAVAVLQIQARNASRRQSQSRAIAAGALTQLATDPQRALLLAQAAWQTSPTTQALNAMQQAVAASRVRLDITGLPPAANGVGWQADDQTVIAAGGSGQLRAWSAIDGRSRGQIKIGQGGVVGFSHDRGGDLGVAATTGGQAVLWSVLPPSRRLMKVMQLAGSGVTNVAISANARMVAVRRRDGSLSVWKPPASAPRTLRLGSAGSLGCLAVSPSGDRVVIGNNDGSVTLWQLARTPREIARYATPATECLFDSSGSYVVTGGEDGSTDVRRVSDGGVRLHIDHVLDAAIAPGGRFLATTDIDGDVQLHDLARGTLTVLQRRGAIEMAVAFSDDGTQLAIGGSDGIARVSRLNGRGHGIELRGATQRIASLSFSHDGKFLLTGDGSGAVIKWALPSPPIALVVRPKQSAAANVTSVALSRNGNVAMTTAGFVWSSSTRTGRTACPAAVECSSPLPATELLAVKAVAAEGVAIDAIVSPDGSHLAVSSQSGRVAIWRARDATELASATPTSDRVDALAFSPDGRLLAASDRRGQTRLLAVENGRLVATLSRDRSPVYAVTFANGGRIVTASADGRVWLWDQRGQFTRTLANLHGTVLALAADPRGGSVAVSSGNQITVVRLFDGHVLQVLNTNAGDISALGYIGHTGLIISGSVDRTVTVWDPQTGQPAQSFALPSGVDSVAADPIGQLIAAGTVSTGAYMLRCDVCVTPAQLVRLAARDSTRALTARERADFKVPAGVLVGQPVPRCAGKCTAVAAAGPASTQTTHTHNAPSTTAPQSKALFISRADAICHRTNSALTPLQARLAADESRADASTASDSLQNRARMAEDWTAVATIDSRKLAALHAIPLPASDQAAARYADAFEAEIPLIEDLVTAWKAPTGPAVSPQHVRSMTTIISIGQRLHAAQQAAISAAQTYGFHVCGSGR